MSGTALKVRLKAVPAPQASWLANMERDYADAYQAEWRSANARGNHDDTTRAGTSA